MRNERKGGGGDEGLLHLQSFLIGTSGWSCFLAWHIGLGLGMLDRSLELGAFFLRAPIEDVILVQGTDIVKPLEIIEISDAGLYERKGMQTAINLADELNLVQLILGHEQL